MHLSLNTTYAIKQLAMGDGEQLPVRPRRDARILPGEMSAGDVAPERKRASGVRHGPAAIMCIAFSTTLLFLLGAAWGQQRSEFMSRGLASSSPMPPTTDGVWTGVSEGIPELCRAGPGLVCDRYEAVVLLGGGPANKDGTLPEWVKRRCDLVLHLYKCCSEARAAHQRDRPDTKERPPMSIITTSAGTAHTPNAVDPEGFHVSEARASSQYLVMHGVRPADIFEESAAWDTIGNAWFTRVMHTDITGMRSLLVVTSDFHLARSQAIFEWIFGLGGSGWHLGGVCEGVRGESVQGWLPSLASWLPLSATSNEGKEGLATSKEEYDACRPYRLGFVGVSDEGIAMASDRSKREATSLESLRKRAKELKWMQQVYTFLYKQHGAYAVGVSPDRLQGQDRRIYNGQ